MARIVALIAILAGCAKSKALPPVDGDADSDVDGDTDTDSDGDADADADADADPCAAEGQSCYDGPKGTRGVGACGDGILECRGGALVCDGWVGPQDEDCDAVDDDCDGEVDGAPAGGGLCATGLPDPCALGSLECVAAEDVCRPDRPPQDETCGNPGVDDDCNGEIDDVADLGAPCDSGLPGVCADGRLACLDGLLACEPAIEPGEISETCDDGTDDDCDGEVDEAECATGVGCADGEREGFLDAAAYPDIAGCSGAWDQPGCIAVEPPSCAREGGDDGDRTDGAGCNVEDLCSSGWHVCLDAADVTASSPDGCAGAADAADAFFLTRVSGTGCGQCATGARDGCSGVDCNVDCEPNAETTNDVFGCGTRGAAPAASCAPLDRFGSDVCSALGAPWTCDGGPAHDDEALNIVKSAPEGGGVLCCRD